MASITDCVVEGLKYPFNDIKNLLGFGVIFAIMNVLSFGSSYISFDIFRANLRENTAHSFIQFISQFPTADILTILSLVICIFIVALFIMGYQYNIVKFSIDKKEDLPGFSDILDIFTKGVKYFIVTLAYNIIPILLFILGFRLEPGTSVSLCIGLISMVLFIIANFLLIMALNNMIAHDDIRKAFEFREIIDNIANLGWGKYIGIIIFTFIVYLIIMIAIGVILAFISIAFAASVSNHAICVLVFIAIIEGLFIDSYVTLFYNRVYGSIYRESIK